MASRSSTADAFKEDNIPKFKNSWFVLIFLLTLKFDFLCLHFSDFAVNENVEMTCKQTSFWMLSVYYSHY